MEQPMHQKGLVEEVWIKPEPSDDCESTTLCHAICEEEELDPFREEPLLIKSETDFDDEEYAENIESPTLNCQICRKGFKSTAGLTRHLTKTHGLVAQVFECTECGKGFPVPSKLTRHLRMHSGEKPFACDICGLRFAQKAHVKPHRRKHTGEKPYSCEHCDNSYRERRLLKEHLRSHHRDVAGGDAEKFYPVYTSKSDRLRLAGYLPFECEKCGKQFYRKDDMARHLRMHLGEKPFSCEICGKRFSQKCHIKPHKLTHTYKDGDRGVGRPKVSTQS